ncbi:hypothetical protein [Desulforegula conservatrix]|uniref:hypothetical protein n=1 Tax=Desulforegula conservatrix TaxID=153026 RepID=UPI0012EBE93D|nr:hypothetical protein [Desulforegula conservatrix]
MEKAIHFNNAKIGDSIKAIKLPTKKYRVNDCKASACQRRAKLRRNCPTGKIGAWRRQLGRLVSNNSVEVKTTPDFKVKLGNDCKKRYPAKT